MSSMDAGAASVAAASPGVRRVAKRAWLLSVIAGAALAIMVAAILSVAV